MLIDLSNKKEYNKTMIVSVGEILADKITENGKETIHVGGAPFNVAVGISECGGDAAFFGCVGDDETGKEVIRQAKEFLSQNCNIVVDKVKKTTVANVIIKNGERSFSFERENTADYQIDFDNLNLEKYSPISILHVGSLMLNKKEGRILAQKLFDYAHTNGIAVSFDVNYRDGLFSSKAEAVATLRRFAESADILKMSGDEMIMLYGDLSECNNTVVCITNGECGSIVKVNGKAVEVPTKKIVPVDTTGAGDAYFGAFLSKIQNVGLGNINLNNIIPIVQFSNNKGAEATQYFGAVRRKNGK